jgi:P27 family predicted phage terminase small subunit
LKVLAGNPGHRPVNANEPRPKAVLPKCPPVLDGEAKAEWRRMARKLHDLGLLSEIDGAALTTYCLTWARLVDAEGKLRQHGTVVISPNGFPVQSPYLAIATKATEQLVRILVEFGMTPSSRARIHVPQPRGGGAQDGTLQRFFGDDADA